MTRALRADIVRGVTPSGAVHVVAAAVALGTGALVLLRTKGTRRHVRLGRLYAATLVLVDLSALLTYEEGAGAFHVLAVVSLTTVAAGLLLAPRRAGSRGPHAVFMVWSFAGLVGAGLAQAATALAPAAAPWPTLVMTTAVCLAAALATRVLSGRQEHPG